MRPRVRVLRKVVGVLLLCLGAAVFFLGGLTSWAARDVAGPGGVESHGVEALVRFAKEFGEFFYIALGFWVGGWFFLRRTP